jgi:3-deoxy-D-manno-octulosonic-acid transferase
MILALVLLNLLAPLLGLAVVLVFLFSPRRALLRRLPEELRERLGRPSAGALEKLAGREVLWVHAASAGEVAAVEGLLARLRRLPEAPAVVMTCTTLAGRNEARRRKVADAAFLAPLDCWPAVGRFLGAVRPYALLLVETELWPNMLYRAKAAGLRIGLVNGRLSARSFERYRLVAYLLRSFLAGIDRLAVQSEADGRRFKVLGAAAERVQVVGNMKFDRLQAGDPTEAGARLRALGWQDCPLWVVGSSHPGEEETVLSAFLSARRRFPSLRLVLAPRHVERSASAAQLLKAAGLPHCLWSSTPDASAQALVLDSLGVLVSFYPYASFSLVGGTLVPVGGHNVLEPALAGSVVLFGPHTAHTRQAAELLAGGGCGFLVKNETELSARLEDLLSDPEHTAALGRQAQALARSLQGATERTWDHLVPVLTPPAGRRKLV